MSMMFLRACLLLLAAGPALAEDEGSADPGFESMPWEMSADEQAALKQRAQSGEAAASNCSSLNSALEMKEASIRRCIEINDGVLQAVYRQYLQDSPQAAGEVTIALDVNATGRVTSSALAGSPTLPLALAEKIRVKVALIIFPRSAGGWEGRHTFRFSP